MKNTFTFLLFCVFSVSVSAQGWLSLVDSADNQNFYAVQKAFYQYWNGRKIEKGKGYNQFKRWEYFMQPRVTEYGRLPVEIWNSELEKLQNSDKSGDTTRLWQALAENDVPVWFLSQNKNGVGRINCIAFHPTNQNVMWCGAPSGGLWKTTNGGDLWITTTDQWSCIGVSDIAINPQNPDIMYVATGDGDAFNTYTSGILKTVDGGKTWVVTGFSYQASERVYVRRIVINPQNPDNLIAATNLGIFRTINAGVEWKKIKSGEFKDVEFLPMNPNTVIATTFGSSSQIYRSTNNGQKFVLASIPSLGAKIGRIKLATCLSDTSAIYALCSDNSYDGFLALLKSENRGLTWTKITLAKSLNLLGWETDGSDFGGQGWYDLALAVSPTNKNEIYVGGINIWKSLDAGANWELCSHWASSGSEKYVHADQHTLVFNPINNTLIAGHDGGISEYSASRKQWHLISEGINVLQFYRMGASALQKNFVVAGAQDIGTLMTKNNQSMQTVMGGDGMECAVDYKNDNTLYYELYYGNLKKSVDGGRSYNDIRPTKTDSGAWLTPFVLHPTDHNTLLIGYHDIYKTTDAGKNWTKISENLSTNVFLSFIAVAPSNPDVIYTGTPHTYYKTENGGATWKQMYSTATTELTYIVVKENNADIAWFSHSGYSGQSVFMTTDGGKTFSDFSQGLPLMPVNCLLYQNNANDALYAGTDVGVFFRDNTMSAWESYNLGLPNVIVNELEIQKLPTGEKRLIAATFGRGLWVAPTFPHANFYADLQDVCVGTEIELINNSYADVETCEWNFGEGAEPQQSTNFTQKISYKTTGEKTITLTIVKDGVSDICTKKSYIRVRDENEFHISPNPAREMLTIQYFANSTGNITLSLSTTDGKLIFKKNYEKTSSVFTQNISIATLQKAVYVVEIEYNGQKQAKKIVVH